MKQNNDAPTLCTPPPVPAAKYRIEIMRAVLLPLFYEWLQAGMPERPKKPSEPSLGDR